MGIGGSPVAQVALLGGGSWTPTDLGGNLLAWWDAEELLSLSLSGSQVSSWTDVVGGRVLSQSVGAAKPTYQESGLNSRPGLFFDGADDILTGTGFAGFPVGADASELWVLLDQQTLPEAVGESVVVGYGGSLASVSRRVTRRTASGVNYAGTRIGAGSTNPAGQNSSVEFTGIHVIGNRVFPTETYVSIDSAQDVPISVVPATANTGTGLTDFQVASTGPGAFLRGTFNTIFVTNRLTDTDRRQLVRFLKKRGGIV